MKSAMVKQVKKHLGYYVSLIAINTLGVILTALLAFDHRMQLAVVVLMTMFGTAWALIHHHLEHDLHPKIVVEYVLMGCLGISIAFFLIH